MNISSNLQLLSEAAKTDMEINTSSSAKYDKVVEAYKAIPEIDGISVTEASDVIVTATKYDEYYVEMVNLAPFMLDSGIKSISKALDLVAEANGLPAKSVGLVVESQSVVDAQLKNAMNRSRSSGNYTIIENAIKKVNNNNATIHKLLEKGYDVVKKSEKSKVCPDCGKAKCVCEKKCSEGECGDGSCGPDGKAVIAECDKKKN